MRYDYVPNFVGCIYNQKNSNATPPTATDEILIYIIFLARRLSRGVSAPAQESAVAFPWSET